MKRLAIIVGHNASEQGAVRADTGESEWSWNGRLADAMAALAPSYGIEARKLLRKPGLGYSAEIDDVYARADSWGAEATVELHFNSFGDPLARGTETLTSTSTGGKRLGKLVQAAMVRELGLRNRGAKAIGRNDRGGRSLYAGRAPAILTEPFFGSNASNTDAVDEPHEMTGLAHAMLEGAAEALGAKVPLKLSPSAPAGGLWAALVAFFRSMGGKA